jgi:hypothetical protein
MSDYENEDILLDEQEVAEEKTPSMSDYDEKGDEGKAIGSVDKAAKSGKPAPGRKGDKKNSEGQEKIKAGDPDRHSESVEITTKGGMINAMYQKFSDMTKEDLQTVFATVMAEDIVLDDEELAEESYQKKLRALSDAEVTLSEEFKAKTAILFEAALQSKVAEEAERIEAIYQERLEEETSAHRSELVEKVDSYLNYVVEQWMTDNQLAIQNGLRTEIAENFMNGMKELFVESYIDVPETKIDLVDDLADQIEELEEALNARTTESIQLMEQVNEMRKEQIVSEAVSDLAETQAEKFRTFFASVDFDDEKSFTEKVSTVKEAHFSGSAATTVAEDVDVEVDEDGAEDAYVESTPMMENYISAIRKISK